MQLVVALPLVLSPPPHASCQLYPRPHLLTCQLAVPSPLVMTPSCSRKQGTTDNAKVPLSMPMPLPSLYASRTTNHAKVLLSLSRKQGAIDGVEVPLLLPSCVPLLSLLLHDQGATNDPEVPLSSMHKQGSADDTKGAHHRCASRGQVTAPRRYCPHCRQCHLCVSKGQPTILRHHCQGPSGVSRRHCRYPLGPCSSCPLVMPPPCIALPPLVASEVHV